MKIDNLEYRKALGKFVTGVAIVTTCEIDGTPRGFTANSFTSVSLDPPLILICIGDFNESLELFKNSKHFSVNILSENQMDISNLFASPSSRKFENTKWTKGDLGSPIIKGALAWFECKNHDQIRSGDHIILIGNVKSFKENSGLPLGYYSGNYITLNNEKSLVSAIEKNTKTILGLIIEKSNSILFYENNKSNELSLPSIGSRGEQSNTSNLIEKFSGLGFKVKLDFVYSVYEDKNLNAVCIYYRCKDNAKPPKAYKYIKFEDIEWKKIKDKALIIMLKRYIEEANHGNFAIYMGDEKSGLTQPLK
jgi:flavin reductase (DIM6/NTAB) family NADH-FMN oxidoreductase RutF